MKKLNKNRKTEKKTKNRNRVNNKSKPINKERKIKSSARRVSIPTQKILESKAQALAISRKPRVIKEKVSQPAKANVKVIPKKKPLQKKVAKKIVSRRKNNRK